MKEKNESDRYRERLTTVETDTGAYVQIYDPDNERAWIRATDTVPVIE